MQFLVIAYDGTDAEAPARRMAAREQHMKRVEAMTAEGRAIHGGAILDEQGQMKGSIMVLEFDSRAEFDAWYDSEIYVTHGVWKDVQVHPFKVAPPFQNQYLRGKSVAAAAD